MTRGTTPTLTLSIEGVDLLTCKSLYVTLQQGGFKLTKRAGEDLTVVDGETLQLYMTQEETLGFAPGNMQLQLRGITMDDIAFATNIQSVSMKNILLEGVIL